MTAPLTRTLAALSALLLLGPARAQETRAPLLPQTPLETALEPLAPLPGGVSVQRRSTVQLPFDAPAQAEALVLAHAPPPGAAYQPGSTRLGGLPHADPLWGPGGTLYWTLSGPARGGAARGVLSYDLAHEAPLGPLPAPGLLARLGGEHSEVLGGRVDAADLAAATGLSGAAVGENPGAIRLPLAGSVLYTRDRVSVVVEVPLGARPALTVNGVPVSQDRLGAEVQDPERGVQRLTFVGVALQPGPNVLRVGGEEVRVTLAGATTRVEVTPERLIADGSTPLRLRVRTLDAFGTPSGQATLTLRASLEPRTPDANPAEAGYQVRLVDGEGTLELQPQTAPTSLRLDVLLGQAVQSHRYEVTPDRRRVGVGVVSLTLGLDGDLTLADDLSWQARAYAETPVGEGKLYLAADKDGLPQAPSPLLRSPVLGDAGSEEAPLQGLDPVAAVYDHPGFRAAYRRGPLPLDVLPVGEQLTALTVSTRGAPGLSGFVAAVPTDRVTGTPVIPDGTRLLRLPDTEISPGSETLEVVTLERGTGKALSRTVLRPGADYLLDLNTGLVTLRQPLERVDAAFNDVQVLASYRLARPVAGRRLAYGAQVRHEGAQYSVGAAVVRLDDRLTFGVRATYDDGRTQADTRFASSGGVQASADLGTRWSAPQGGGAASVRLRYQDAAYAGLAPFGVGLSVRGSVSAQLGQRLGAVVEGAYQSAPSTQSASVTARGEYRLAPFSVGAGLTAAFGDTAGLGAVASVGYHQSPLDLDVVHTQPLGGDLGGDLAPLTVITTRYRLSDRVTLGFSDRLTWGTGHAAALTLDTALGNTNYAASYELPTADGAGNRARFGVDTTLPLGARTTLGLRASVLYDLGAGEAELAGGADLSYRGEGFSAGAGLDLTRRGGEVGAVVRGGVTGSLGPHLTLTADGLAEFGAGRNGQRAALGYAYRNRTLNSLGYLRLVRGTLAGGRPELSSGLSAEYRQPRYALRAGADTRTLLGDPGSFTVQGSLGGTLYLHDRFGVGAWGRVLTQPSTATRVLGYGLEASVRALPGTWLTGGYNFRGFEGLPGAGTYTKRGAYLRLDLTLDESVGEKK